MKFVPKRRRICVLATCQEGGMNGSDTQTCISIGGNATMAGNGLNGSRVYCRHLNIFFVVVGSGQ